MSFCNLFLKKQKNLVVGYVRDIPKKGVPMKVYQTHIFSSEKSKVELMKHSISKTTPVKKIKEIQKFLFYVVTASDDKYLVNYEYL